MRRRTSKRVIVTKALTAIYDEPIVRLAATMLGAFPLVCAFCNEPLRDLQTVSDSFLDAAESPENTCDDCLRMRFCGLGLLDLVPREKLEVFGRRWHRLMFHAVSPANLPTPTEGSPAVDTLRGFRVDYLGRFGEPPAKYRPRMRVLYFVGSRRLVAFWKGERLVHAVPDLVTAVEGVFEEALQEHRVGATK